MKTIEVTPEHFISKFGPEYIASDSFTYYECDNGLGIIKDNVKNSIQLVSRSEISIEEISQEDEFALLSMVCGDFKTDIDHPTNDTLSDFEFRERKASRNFTLTWTVMVTMLFICTLLSLLLYSYLRA
ncbi:hypothetical protein [Paenibacillus sinopodophylli]|uniref:hypothetical protein n=1 Tax=Paenibacillus sinopodophylli TaxID=1837342 RepID=UPI00110CDD61|nr:hypothetical protein [Paenibacillus sinopodophylli]